MNVLVQSMTGYGRSQAVIDGYDITVEFRSVNHRYFEFQARLPRAYGYVEDKLKNLVHHRIHRGKVDVYVGITALDTTDTLVRINHALAQSYKEELDNLGEALELENDITLSKLARFGDIFTLQRATEDEDKIWALVQEVAEEALEQFVAMRRAEGQQLRDDITGRLDTLEGYTRQIDARSPEIVKEYRERLSGRLQEVLSDHQIEEARMLTEAAIFAERTAVDEETVRLHSHLDQFRTILQEPDAIGRKLDFLVQEINRETNTIGSKSQDVETSKLVVEMKSETEKIREQIQNIE